MGLARMTAAELQRTPGFQDAFAIRKTLDGLDSGMARRS